MSFSGHLRLISTYYFDEVVIAEFMKVNCE